LVLLLGWWWWWWWWWWRWWWVATLLLAGVSVVGCVGGCGWVGEWGEVDGWWRVGVCVGGGRGDLIPRTVYTPHTGGFGALASSCR
jgi:hypothetical protein